MSNNERTDIELVENKNYPSKILGLDISTSCIGVSIITDDGVNKPKIELITHVVPKIPNKIKGIEALIMRKKIFEEEFLNKIKDSGITECVIEAPLIFALGNSNPTTVAQLLKFNALLSEGIYNELGIIPYYISSLNARIYAFPELLGIRKFNKRGEVHQIKHILKDIETNHIVPFADYPFDCDKKNIVMNLVSDKFPEINWVHDKKGSFRKENFDACDSLVCALSYANIKRYDLMHENICETEIIKNDGYTIIKYVMDIWGKKYHKELMIED